MWRNINLKLGLLSKLARVTASGRTFVPQIDGLRFIAIMAVVAYHISLSYLFHRGLTSSAQPVEPFWLNTILSTGHNGVPLFFAISGFILSLPFARHAICDGPSVCLPDYYRRRVTRIEPPYVIQLLLMAALCFLILRKLPSHPHLYHNPDWFQYASSHILASLVYAHSLIFGQHAYPNAVLWSLEVEIQFYLLAPYIARVLFIRNRIRRRATFAVFMMAGMAVNFFFGSHYRVWTSLIGNLQYFIIGFIFADLYVEGQLVKSSGGCKWDFAFILAIALAVLGDNATGVVLLPTAIFLCFMAAFRGAFVVKFLTNPWVATIGGMCYSIYLYHMVLISLFIKATQRVSVSNLSLDLLIQVVLLIVVIIPVCSLLFLLFEKPFMYKDWPAKVWNVISQAAGRKVAANVQRHKDSAKTVANSDV